MSTDRASAVGRWTAALVLAALAVGASPAGADPTGANGPKPKQEEILVIGHRGAGGYLPEHTLAAYQLAIEQCGSPRTSPSPS